MLNYVLVGALGLFALITVFLVMRLLLLKKDLKQIREELIKTREDDYNRSIRVSLTDGDMEILASEINRNLEHQKDLKLEAQRSRKQLQQSISDIAHDLRTPLTVVKGNLQMLEKEALSEEGRERLRISERKAETLKGMVDEFFELSVLESDSKPVELSKLDLMEFLPEFIVENETLIRQHGLTPNISLPEQSLSFYVCAGHVPVLTGESPVAGIYTILNLKRQSVKDVQKTKSEKVHCTLPRAARREECCTSVFIKFLPGFFQEAAFSLLE